MSPRTCHRSTGAVACGAMIQWQGTRRCAPGAVRPAWPPPRLAYVTPCMSSRATTGSRPACARGGIKQSGAANSHGTSGPADTGAQRIAPSDLLCGIRSASANQIVGHGTKTVVLVTGRAMLEYDVSTSTNPTSFKPCRNALKRCAKTFGRPLIRKPINRHGRLLTEGGRRPPQRATQQRHVLPPPHPTLVSDDQSIKCSERPCRLLHRAGHASYFPAWLTNTNDVCLRLGAWCHGEEKSGGGS